jgi:thioredoxin reductase
LTCDGVPPSELLGRSRAECARYGVEILDERAVSAKVLTPGRLFEVTLEKGARLRARRLLLATGVVDRLPAIDGLAQLFGNAAFTCPFCHGWEHRGQRWAALSTDSDFALALLSWSRDLVLLTNGYLEIPQTQIQYLAEQGISVRTERIKSFGGEQDRLQRITFEKGPPLERDVLFLDGSCVPGSELPAQLGCKSTRRQSIETNDNEESSVPGVWVVGDASKDAMFAIVAAGEGAKAAKAIQKSLRIEQFGSLAR